MRSILYVSFFFLIGKATYAQTNRQRIDLYAYNIGFAGITTGLGRAINKDKNERFFKEFWSGCKHGFIGGSVSFTGKLLAHQIKKTEHLYWAWPSKIVHSYGVSIMENSALHKPLFTSMRLPVWFVMADINFDKLGIKFKVMPASLISFTIAAAYNRFILSKSLESGVGYFEYYNNGSVQKISGYSTLNTININTSYDYIGIGVQPHELIHNLQTREYYLFNTFWKKTKIVDKIKKSTNRSVRFLKNNFYPDLYYFYIPYYISKSLSKNFFDNIFELEAQHIALNRYIY